MKKLVKKFAYLGTILAVGLPGASTQASSKALKLVVIVKASGALADMGAKDVRAVYLGDKQFQNGARIEPLLNGQETLEEAFFRSVLSTTRPQFKKIWSSKAFVDGLAAPAVLPASEDVIREVRKNDDAIGFVDPRDISADDMASLKVIDIVDK